LRAPWRASALTAAFPERHLSSLLWGEFVPPCHRRLLKNWLDRALCATARIHGVGGGALAGVRTSGGAEIRAPRAGFNDDDLERMF